MDGVLSLIREKPRPVLVEAETYRWHGHYEGDPQRYRDEDEVRRWKARDPLLVLRERLTDAGTDGSALDAIDAEVVAEIDRGVQAARSAPEPAPESLSRHVLAPRAQVTESRAPEGGEVFRTMDAVRSALSHEMAADPSVFVAGIDVGAGGGVFGLTRGLFDEFPGRVLDTPISETALLGAAVGAAMAGMRPVVELMYMDFLGVCFDQLLNQAAKLRYMTGGRAGIPLVVRTQIGAGRSSGSQHSQSLEALLAHVPGLSVVMPSTPAETYGLLRAAIRDPNPVIFVENRSQYGWKGPCPAADYVVPLGKARIVQSGTDVTLVSWSRMLHESVAAASIVAEDGISVEVVDLRSIVPLDRETVLSSFRRTNRMVIAHEAVRDFGVGAELAAMAVDEGFWSLDAPVIRAGAPYTPAPYAPSLERAWLPDRSTIADALRRVAAA
jgi:2-oxoisovalerate dehydrogenase E1 component